MGPTMDTGRGLIFWVVGFPTILIALVWVWIQWWGPWFLGACLIALVAAAWMQWKKDERA